jgi:tRNA G46 methylase TrmB
MMKWQMISCLMAATASSLTSAFSLSRRLVCLQGCRLSSSHRRAVHRYSSHQPTAYTITCPPSDPATLQAIVHKHVTTLDRYLASKPIAQHTLAAFETLQAQMKLHSCDTTSKIILDSGCGTGRSSLHLGALYPNHTILGVDRSISRLSRNRFFEGAATDDMDDGYGQNDDENCAESVQKVSSNVWLVRAELVDFWRCCLREQWPIEQHYLLYPNPYPKKARLKNRWYAHPSFPLLLLLQSDKIVLRSNWKQYLDEFRDSVHYAAASYDALGQDSAGVVNFARTYSFENGGEPLLQTFTSEDEAWTNFEKKYWKTGEATFEIVLSRADMR